MARREEGKGEGGAGSSRWVLPRALPEAGNKQFCFRCCPMPRCMTFEGYCISIDGKEGVRYKAGPKVATLRGAGCSTPLVLLPRRAKHPYLKKAIWRSENIKKNGRLGRMLIGNAKLALPTSTISNFKKHAMQTAISDMISAILFQQPPEA